MGRWPGFVVILLRSEISMDDNYKKVTSNSFLALMVNTIGVVYVYYPLFIKLPRLFYGPGLLEKIMQTIYHPKYYYLYFGLSLTLWLCCRLYDAYEFIIMNVRLWLRRHFLIDLPLLMLLIAMIGALLCTKINMGN